MKPTTIWVCTTCRAADEPVEPRSQRSGARLYADLCSTSSDDIEVTSVECLSVCTRPCTIAFSAPGKWTYVYGNFAPDAAPAVLAAASLYGAAPMGLIPWKLRPDALKKGVVARIPPFPPHSDGSR